LNPRTKKYQPKDSIEEKINQHEYKMGTSKKAKSKSALSDPMIKDASDAKLQNLISQAPVLIATYHGPTFIVETVNKTALNLWGKSYEEVINKPLFEVSPELEESLTKILNGIYATGEPYIANEIAVEVKHTGKADTAYFNMVYQPMHNLDNKIYGILLIGTEVTETVNARKKIEESEKRFNNILSQSLMAIAIFTGPDMVVTFANEQMLTVLGKGNAILNKPLLEGVPELKNQAFPQLLADVYTTGVAFEGFETKAILARNGIPVDVYFNFVYQPYRDLDDTITGISVLATEVTEQVLAKKQIEKNNEEIKKIASHLKLATDSAKVGIWSLDLLSSKLDWSDIHKKMWGYDGYSEDITYEDWYKAIVPEDRELALRKVEEAKVFPGIYEVDYRITRMNDGVIVWLKSTGLYHYDKFGIAHTFTGITIDISEQKRIDAELIEAKTKAESDKKIADHAVMAKQQFLSNMSHEIRTPMNAIIGFTKVLMKTDLSEKQKEYLQAIKSSGSTLTVLIDDILDLAKVDAGKMKFINAPFKISESITTILHLLETKIQESNLELVKEYDSRIPEIVLGDSVRLHQILINLLGNAIKFTAKGTITVSANLVNEDKENVTIEIKVSDTGIGIPTTKIETVFENFEQAHSINPFLYGGTGLGLAIVKQLVEKQGGTISVKSKVDEGSTFSFTLSFQKKQTDHNSDLEEDTEIELDNEIKEIKVLVVEDVKLNQLLLGTILDDFRFAWDMADNGKIAIEKLQTTAYDIILMDLQMPIMNGFEATEYIRNKMNLQIPIIALTADVTTVDVDKCKFAGMNDYISKPLDEKLLYSKILDLIKSK
jgi:PAS domain S-box-containing protein